MKIIEIAILPNGGHRNQICELDIIPKGWAKIPDDMETPNFPFGEITTGEIDGVMTVTSWTPGVIPEVEEPTAKPTAEDDINAMLIDHEYRLTLMELGVNE